MSESSPSSEKQPESPLPRIDQHSSADSRGGQQAAIGNNNNQFQDNSTHFIFNIDTYEGLQDKDLEPLSLQGRILSYFGVFIVLVLTLVFWFFFGLFINFPFPYYQAIELIFNCFKGNIGSKVNKLQWQLQLKDTDSQSIEKLNELDFEARLYLLVLERLGADKAESHERLAKTIEVLRRRRTKLQTRIKPQQPKEYQVITKAQEYLEAITLNQAEKDFMQIETVLNDLVWSIKNDYPSETIVQDAVEKLSREITRKAAKISPSKIGILYRIEALLHETSAKGISNLGESELNSLNKKTINDLKEQREKLVKKFNNLLNEYDTAKQELDAYSEESYKLNNLINEYKLESLKLRETIRQQAETNQNNRGRINILNSDLAKVSERLRESQARKITLDEEIKSLKRDLCQKQGYIDELTSKLEQYSGMRKPEGNYIGNLSERNTKYHFDPKCNHWKMLVGEYVLGLDTSREIATSKTSAFFIGKLEECDRCAGRKN